MYLQKRHLWFALKLNLSTVLLYWILSRTNLSEVWQAIRSTNYGVLFVAFLLHPIGLYISALRWQILLAARGSTPSLNFLFESYLVGMFFNNFLPSTIGGDIYRAYDTWRLGQTKSSAVAVIFIDRLLGILVLLLFALIAIILDQRFNKLVDHLWMWILLGTFGLCIAVYLIFFPPTILLNKTRNVSQLENNKIGAKLVAFAEAFLAFKGQHQALYKTTLLSILLQANVVVHYYLIGLALPIDVPLTGYFLIVPIVTVVMMLPISINGIGLREGTFALFFSIYGVTATDSIAFAWIAFALLLIQSILGGILYVYRK